MKRPNLRKRKECANGSQLTFWSLDNSARTSRVNRRGKHEAIERWAVISHLYRGEPGNWAR